MLDDNVGDANPSTGLHGSEAPRLPCKYCTGSYKNAGALNTHVSRKHGQENRDCKVTTKAHKLQDRKELELAAQMAKERRAAAAALQ